VNRTIKNVLDLLEGTARNKHPYRYSDVRVRDRQPSLTRQLILAVFGQFIHLSNTPGTLDLGVPVSVGG
jgi:hypothetical protein